MSDTRGMSPKKKENRARQQLQPHVSNRKDIENVGPFAVLQEIQVLVVDSKLQLVLASDLGRSQLEHLILKESARFGSLMHREEHPRFWSK